MFFFGFPVVRQTVDDDRQQDLHHHIVDDVEKHVLLEPSREVVTIRQFGQCHDVILGDSTLLSEPDGKEGDEAALHGIAVGFVRVALHIVERVEAVGLDALHDDEDVLVAGVVYETEDEGEVGDQEEGGHQLVTLLEDLGHEQGHFGRLPGQTDQTHDAQEGLVEVSA